MKQSILKVHPNDNVLVALRDLQADEQVQYEGVTYTVTEFIPAKHKFAINTLPQGADVIMYGVLVGKTQSEIPAGGLLSTKNVKHAANSFLSESNHHQWQSPDVSEWQGRTFNGFHRADGSVGTANYWLVIPMVFCENRNVQVLEEALVKPLGYGRKQVYEVKAQQLINMVQNGVSIDEVLYTEIEGGQGEGKTPKVFPNVDGIKFLTHEGGCGGI
jgi:altronate hydrolase